MALKFIHSNEHSIIMKKQDIFDTALSLIVSQGLHATPMAQIAKEANVAAGTIYHYFKSKDEMIHELYINIHGELEEVMDLDDIDLDNYEAEFDAVCLRIFKYLIQNPLEYYFLQQYENSPLGFGKDELNKNMEFPIPVRFFQLGFDNNLIKTMPLSLVSNLVFNSITTIAGLHLSKKIELDKEIIQAVIDGSWNMIMA